MSIKEDIELLEERMSIPYAYTHDEIVSDLLEIIKKLNDKIETLEARQ